MAYEARSDHYKRIQIFEILHLFRNVIIVYNNGHTDILQKEEVELANSIWFQGDANLMLKRYGNKPASQKKKRSENDNGVYF